jgi:spore coat polysaccharide biosynthesis protein SpsF
MNTVKPKDPMIIATIEARMSSTRLPGKVLLPAAGKPLLEHLVERLRRVRHLDGIVIATTVKGIDDPIVRLASKLDVGYFRGSEDDVLGRVLGAARTFCADVIVEITSDCPLIDPEVVESCIDGYFAKNVDYASNFLQETYPRGMATQVFATRVLDEVNQLTQDPVDREHVSLYIYSHSDKYRLTNVMAPRNLARPELRLTLDTLEDYDVIKAVLEALYPVKADFGLSDIISFLDLHPEIAAINVKAKQKLVRGLDPYSQAAAYSGNQRGVEGEP